MEPSLRRLIGRAKDNIEVIDFHTSGDQVTMMRVPESEADDDGGNDSDGGDDDSDHGDGDDDDSIEVIDFHKSCDQMKALSLFHQSHLIQNVVPS